MAVRNDKFKSGTDWGEEGLKPSEFNATLDAIVNMAGKGQAQNAYQTLQANDVFDNKDFLCADEFTDSNGTNNTVNVDSPALTSWGDVDSETFSAPTPNDNGYSVYQNKANAKDGNTGTYAYFTYDQNDGFGGQTVSVSFGYTFSSAKYVNTVDYKAYINNSSAPRVANNLIIIQIYDGATWSNETTISSALNETVDSVYSLNKTVEGIRIIMSTKVESTTTQSFRIYELEYSITTTAVFSTDKYVCIQDDGDYIDSTLLIDANTLTLDGTEEALCVYSDVTNTTNTSMTVDISDGTTTLSAQALNTVVALPSAWTTGTLKLTFNLATTDTSATPELKGYGVYMI